MCFTIFHFWRIRPVGCSGPRKILPLSNAMRIYTAKTKPINQLWQEMRWGNQVLFPEERYREVIVRRATANPAESFPHASNAHAFRALKTKHTTFNPDRKRGTITNAALRLPLSNAMRFYILKTKNYIQKGHNSEQNRERGFVSLKPNPPCNRGPSRDVLHH